MGGWIGSLEEASFQSRFKKWQSPNYGDPGGESSRVGGGGTERLKARLPMVDGGGGSQGPGRRSDRYGGAVLWMALNWSLN